MSSYVNNFLSVSNFKDLFELIKDAKPEMGYFCNRSYQVVEGDRYISLSLNQIIKKFNDVVVTSDLSDISQHEQSETILRKITQLETEESSLMESSYWPTRIFITLKNIVESYFYNRTEKMDVIRETISSSKIQIAPEEIKPILDRLLYLQNMDRIALREFVELCRNPDKSIYQMKKLIEHGLIDTMGKPDNHVKYVVLNYVEGHDFSITINRH